MWSDPTVYLLLWPWFCLIQDGTSENYHGLAKSHSSLLFEVSLVPLAMLLKSTYMSSLANFPLSDQLFSKPLSQAADRPLSSTRDLSVPPPAEYSMRTACSSHMGELVHFPSGLVHMRMQCPCQGFTTPVDVFSCSSYAQEFRPLTVLAALFLSC